MTFCGIALAYMKRICFSLTINEMTSTRKGIYFLRNHLEEKRFRWTEKETGFLFSSFYIGAVLTHVPGAIFAEKYGGKYVFSLSILVAAIFTLIMPICAENGQQFFFFILFKLSEKLPIFSRRFLGNTRIAILHWSQ